MKKLTFLFIGMYFGILLMKGEIASWYRIQEMFRFQSIQMYGIIGLAVAIGALSVFLIKKLNIQSIDHESIHLSGKPFTKGNIFGGILFGCGWAMTGACPGPLYALVGSGYFVMIAVFVSAICGAYVYGLVKDQLPH